jgi:uncharacterized repeat protein (TIGR03803 family)
MQGTDGNFYGTTLYGGVSGHGAVFKITAAGALTGLYTFCPHSGCSDGSLPANGLIQAANGSFYGTTSSGGTLNYGTVFSISVGLLNFAALGEQVDYFGDRKADITVWRPSNETWYSIDGPSN